MRNGSGKAVDRLADIVDRIIKGLVDDEEAVKVDVIAESMHTNLKVSVASRDFGKVLGRQGHNAEAIRSLVKAIGHKLKLPSCVMYIEDPNPDRRGRGSSGPKRRTGRWD